MKHYPKKFTALAAFATLALTGCASSGGNRDYANSSFGAGYVNQFVMPDGGYYSPHTF